MLRPSPVLINGGLDKKKIAVGRSRELLLLIVNVIPCLSDLSVISGKSIKRHARSASKLQYHFKKCSNCVDVIRESGVFFQASVFLVPMERTRKKLRVRWKLGNGLFP